MTPHVPIERRGFLATATATAAASLLFARRGAAVQDAAEPPPEEDLSLDFERFLALANPLARELVRDTTRLGEDRYLHCLAALAARLSDVPVPEMNRKGTGGPYTYIGANEGGDPFTVLHWRMEPGSVIGHHAHTYGNVVTLGLEGLARIQNFEMLGERDFETRDTFRVRKCVEQALVPGEINLVPLSHRYCHGFVAGPEGARGLDITTRIRPKRAAPLLEVLGGPLDDLGCVFEARWRFN